MHDEEEDAYFEGTRPRQNGTSSRRAPGPSLVMLDSPPKRPSKTVASGSPRNEPLNNLEVNPFAQQSPFISFSVRN